MQEKVWYTIREKAVWPSPLPEIITVTVAKVPKDQWRGVDQEIEIITTWEELAGD